MAPNLTALVGELVGARLIAHGGILLNLAKQPGSTVQILGAEKALFRALKTKHATPKYGLIYHASLIGQAAPKHKGKIARSLASKASLAIRYDALGDGQDNTMGLENRVKLEARLRALEGKELGKSTGSAKGKPKIEVYDKDLKKGAGALITPAKVYNPSADSVLGRDENEEKKMNIDEPSQIKEAEKIKEKKKKKKSAEAEDNVVSTDGADIGESEETSSKKEEKKKKKRDGTEENVEVEKSKKKKRKYGDVDEDGSETADKKKEKKKKKKKSEE